jgi:hypothetical protein
MATAENVPYTSVCNINPTFTVHNWDKAAPIMAEFVEKAKVGYEEARAFVMKRRERSVSLLPGGVGEGGGGGREREGVRVVYVEET